MSVLFDPLLRNTVIQDIYQSHLKYIIHKINPITSQKTRKQILGPKINSLGNPGQNY